MTMRLPRLLTRRDDAAAPAVVPRDTLPGGPAPELVERREDLFRRFAELQWDLGGLAYEMARRDHYRLEVLNRRAAELQEVDAELGEVDRLMRLADAGAAGACTSCGAPHSRGATFCWQCGAPLRGGDAPTVAMPATNGNGPH